MGRPAIRLLVVVLALVALLPVRAFLTKEREVIASTPTASTGLPKPIGLAPGSEVCADQVLFAANAEVARFQGSMPDGTSAPALRVVASGDREGEYRNDYRAAGRARGGWSGLQTIDVPLEPPVRDVFGTFCVRNDGSESVVIVGNDTGRAIARPRVTVDGEPIALELPLRLLEAERSSYLARAGRIIAQASTLRPFGPWFWWLGIAVVLLLVPAALALAMRTALAADAAVGAREAPRSWEWPFERLRARAAAVPGWAVLAAACTLAVLWFFYWGVNTHVFQHDEDQYLYLARWAQLDLPSRLLDFDTFGRGLQRLEVWLLMIPSLLFDSPESLVGGRLLNTIAFVSTAIPVYLLGRGMGLRPHWAALPAVFSAVVPWAVVTTSLLTENVAYPAFVWVVWSMWRAIVAPSRWRDLLALALLVVAGAARSGLLLIAPALPLAVLVVGLRCGAGSAWRRLVAVLRAHAVLWAAVAVAVLPLVLAPLGVGVADEITQRLAGGYPTRADFDVLALLEKSATYFSRVVVGTGVLSAVFALPWLVVGLVRPRDRDTAALAAVIVLATLTLFVSLAPAGPDERYIVYLAPLVLLPATLAVARREYSPLGVAIASVLVAALLWRVTWNHEQGPFGFFVSPVEMFYGRVVGLRLSDYLPGDATVALDLAALGVALLGVGLAALLRFAPRRIAGPPVALLVGAVALLMLVQTDYALSKFVNGPGSRAAADLRERAFVDETVPGGASLGQLAEGAGLRPEFAPLWQELQFYNERIERIYTFSPQRIASPPSDTQVWNLGYDERTGRVISPVPLPDYLAIPAPFGDLRLRGEIVAAPRYIAIALFKVDQPATVAWRTTGFRPGGAVPEDGEGVIRIYGRGLEPGDHCATITIAATPEAGARWRMERSGRRVDRGRLEPAEQRAVPVALPRLIERGYVDVSVSGAGTQVLAVAVDGACAPSA
jgi:hypothetical protein